MPEVTSIIEENQMTHKSYSVLSRSIYDHGECFLYITVFGAISLSRCAHKCMYVVLLGNGQF